MWRTSDSASTNCAGSDDTVRRTCTYSGYNNDRCQYSCLCEGLCTSLTVVLFQDATESDDYEICEVAMERPFP